jgi:anti-sigma-K factor RskA
MTDHDQTLLGPYVLGVLEPGDVREVEEHLPGCSDCRQQLVELEEMKQFLGEVPPEAFLDGPPTDGDLLLQRTLRAGRALDDPHVPAVAASRRPRWQMAAASVAVIAAAALGGGVLIGRESVEYPPNQQPVAGSIHAVATEASTGATMATTVEPRADWSWVNVRITGLKAGAECEMVVTDTDGETYVAGSWVVSEEAARDGSKFSGGVQVPIDQVASVEVKNTQGEHVVTTSL